MNRKKFGGRCFEMSDASNWLKHDFGYVYKCDMMSVILG